MKPIFLLLALIGNQAYATGYLQNSDFATGAQITSAGGNAQAQLLQSSNVSDSVDGVNLNTQIAIWNAKQAALTNQSCSANNFVSSNTGGTFTCTQPSFSNLSGTATLAQLPGTGATTVNGQSCALGSACTISVGSGTVTSASVVSANGFAGTVATATTTPAITLSTTVTGLLKGNGTAVSAAASGTDYAPATSGSAILKGNGAGGFSSAVSGTDYAPATSGAAILYGNGAGGFSNVTIGSNLTFSGGTLSATGGGGGSAITVLTKTATYSIVSGDFGSSYVLLLRANCASACTIALPAASTLSGYEVEAINVGTAVATIATNGTDTFGTTADTTWTLIPGGSPQSGNRFISAGSAANEWDGF